MEPPTHSLRSWIFDNELQEVGRKNKGRAEVKFLASMEEEV